MGLVARTLPIALIFQVASQQMNVQDIDHYSGVHKIEGISKISIVNSHQYKARLT